MVRLQGGQICPSPDAAQPTPRVMGINKYIHHHHRAVTLHGDLEITLLCAGEVARCRPGGLHPGLLHLGRAVRRHAPGVRAVLRPLRRQAGLRLPAQVSSSRAATELQGSSVLPCAVLQDLAAHPRPGRLARPLPAPHRGRGGGGGLRL